jgi:hypothetical protein
MKKTLSQPEPITTQNQPLIQANPDYCYILLQNPQLHLELDSGLIFVHADTASDSAQGSRL